tara:strand:- start:902 stop:1234 length:333 start_codon:yes stop_codon:yes gene_type:complete
MIQLSQLGSETFYVNFGQYNYGEQDYIFKFTSLSTDATTEVTLKSISHTERAFKFSYDAATLFAGQYIVDIYYDTKLLTSVTAYVQGTVLVSGGNFTDYQSVNTTKYFEG